MKYASTILIFFCFIVLTGCSPASDVPAFDKDRAFGFLKSQVEFGPRYAGAPGHDRTADFIQMALKSYADAVRTQDFSCNVAGKTVDMRNIIAYFNAGAKSQVLLAAHWDTRPTADCEVTAEKRKMPIPGANDGASGVAVLLEMARVFSARKPDVGVIMVFFDGEDYGPARENMFLGSCYFAANLDRFALPDGKPVNIRHGILLDMVGDRNLKVYQEQNSVEAAPELVNKIWAAAKALGHEDEFVPEVKYSIDDDHIPLIRAGLKCVDLIDFEYGPWHTLDDTPDKCSPQSLKAVGEVVARVIYEEKA